MRCGYCPIGVRRPDCTVSCRIVGRRFELDQECFDKEMVSIWEHITDLEEALGKLVYTKVCYDVNGYKLPECCVECETEKGDPHDTGCSLGKLL